MSREFGWTPEQLDRVTLQELEHYTAKSRVYRDTVPLEDVTLVAIRQALFSFFGVKEGQAPDEKLVGMASAQMNKEESDAWLAAGMPSPLDAWLNERRSHG